MAHMYCEIDSGETLENDEIDGSCQRITYSKSRIGYQLVKFVLVFVVSSDRQANFDRLQFCKVERTNRETGLEWIKTTG